MTTQEAHRTIVYIDNDTKASNSFKNFYTSKNYNVKTFTDPIEAFYWIKDNNVDLIVSEINLPILSGISLLRKLRLHSNLSNIPFILLTNNMVKFIPDAKKVKANDLYPKPLDFEKFLKRVKYLSKIKIDHDTDFQLLQKTWSRRIYPGHLKRITSLLFALLLLTLSLPILLTIYLILIINGCQALKYNDKIGAGYDLIHFINFNTSNTFGKFLKRYNIHRWPELLNVIKGDISIIGNKALPLSEAQKYTSDKYSIRFLSPTGLTGLRHIYDVKEKKDINIACDLENQYAMQQRNLFKDIFIFFKTIPYLFRVSNNLYYDL